MNNITIVDDISYLFKYDYCTKDRKIEYVYQPLPYFNKEKDQLVVFIKSKFGPKNWELPVFSHYFEEESQMKYCYLARNLLEGNMFGFFKATQKFYV